MWRRAAEPGRPAKAGRRHGWEASALQKGEVTMKARRGDALFQLILVLLVSILFSVLAMPHLKTSGEKQVGIVKTTTEKAGAAMDAAVGPASTGGSGSGSGGGS